MAQKRPNFAQTMLSWAHIGPAASFDALLVGWLVVVARGMYLARHLSTFFIRVLDKDSFGSKVLERYVVCITSENKG